MSKPTKLVNTKTGAYKKAYPPKDEDSYYLDDQGYELDSRIWRLPDTSPGFTAVIFGFVVIIILYIFGSHHE